MKIRSLLLGSVAAAGLSTAGFAADLGVVTSLDVCDELGLSGLTISSDDNCLVITGNVSMEYNIGDYNNGDSPLDFGADDDGSTLLVFDRGAPGTSNSTLAFVNNNDGTLDSKVDIDAWLKFVASGNSDFGKTWATIKLLSENFTGTGDPAVVIDEAFVGIGDTTVLQAGYAPSIFFDKDDEPLNYLGLFNSDSVDKGVGFRPDRSVPVADGDLTDAGEFHGTVQTGGASIQLIHNVADGLTIAGALEDLGSKYDSLLSAVGVIKYVGDGVSAHVSSAIDTTGLYNVHAGFKGTWDPITVAGAVAVSNGWWNALGSASATFDMFTLAASVEATSGGEWGAGGSVAATVTDGVTLNLGGRYFTDTTNTIDTGWQTEAGVSVAATEAITLTAAIGAIDSNRIATTFYGKGGVAWNPGGGFKASVEGEANTLGGYKGTFKASKEIK